jgi:enoyl-CoA hydratase/carnithine racemase
MPDGVVMDDVTVDEVVLFDEIATASGHAFGRATLNAPTSLNALSLTMIDLLAQRFDAWAADPSVVGVVLDAAGDRAFCAGGDVLALYSAIRAADGGVPVGAADFFEREYRLDYRIHTYPKPVLCWGHGIVMGGGIGLLAGASHRVATAKTRFAMPEIAIGLYPDVGGSWILGRMPGRIGLFLALTGASLNAADARFAGLADFTLPHEAKQDVLDAIAAGRWHADRELDGSQLTHVLDQRAEREVQASPLRAHFDRIDDVIGHDALSDIASRLTALGDDPDLWLASAGKAFARGSPTSAALSYRLQQDARHLSLADVFRREYQASVGCCMRHDFPEGVRALLIDKDKNPRWQPATLDEVTTAEIDAHLMPAFDGPHPLADLQ